MNIGILTFHYAHNYGAVLQAYALKKILEESEHTVELINYHNRVIEKCYPYQRAKKAITWKNGYQSVIKDVIHNYEIMTGDRSWKKHYENFEQWIKTHLDIKDKAIYSISELELQSYDILICGSDQIWNPNLTNGFDPVYFLDFETNALRISYAASMGIEKLERRFENKFFDYIDKLDGVSVREETLKTYITKRRKYPVEVVLDPVLLLNREDYLKLIRRPKYKKYILMYSLKEDPKLKRIAKVLAKKKGMQCIEVKYYNNAFQHDIKQIAYAGPSEFLGLFAYADCVVTNSFHGTAYSLIFNKEFYCTSAGAVNSRISDLLKKMNLSDRMIAGEILPDKINYDEVNTRLDKERENSRSFLEHMISLRENNKHNK
jgi:hypothetical protein